MKKKSLSILCLYKHKSLKHPDILATCIYIYMYFVSFKQCLLMTSGKKDLQHDK